MQQLAEMESQRAEYEKQILDLHAQLHDAVKEAVQIPDSPDTATIGINTSFSADALQNKATCSATTTLSSTPNTVQTGTSAPNAGQTGTNFRAGQPRIATDAKSAECNACIVM